MPLLSRCCTPARSITRWRNSRRPRLIDDSSRLDSSAATIRPLQRITYTAPQWRPSTDSDMEPPWGMQTLYHQSHSASPQQTPEADTRITIGRDLEHRFQALQKC